MKTLARRDPRPSVPWQAAQCLAYSAASGVGGAPGSLTSHHAATRPRIRTRLAIRRARDRRRLRAKLSTLAWFLSRGRWRGLFERPASSGGPAASGGRASSGGRPRSDGLFGLLVEEVQALGFHRHAQSLV